MSNTTREILSLIDILPESDQKLACELIKKMVLAWDPDFTKLTPNEYADLVTAEEEVANGEYVSHSDINW